MAKTLDSYRGVRFNELNQIDGVKVVAASTQKNTAVPVESFTSNMYYVANPRTKAIDHITFYDKNGDIKHSIDLEFNNDGSLKHYKEFEKKGIVKTEGSHFHRYWPQDDLGNKRRTSHDKNNIEPINRYYMRFVNKAIEYNQKLHKNE